MSTALSRESKRRAVFPRPSAGALGLPDTSSCAINVQTTSETAENQAGPESRQLNDEALEAERRPSKDQHESVRCRHCGEPVHGRRRNGYCSDRCRMAVHRQCQAERVNRLLATIEQTVTALRAELEGPR